MTAENADVEAGPAPETDADDSDAGSGWHLSSSGIDGITDLRRPLAAAVGVTSLLSALALATVPLGPGMRDLLFFGHLLAFFVLALWVVGAELLDPNDEYRLPFLRSDDDVDLTLPDPPRETRNPAADLLGAPFDREVDPERDPDPETRYERIDPEATAIALTVDVLRAAGLDEPTARTAVETGSWTDDPRAAAYVGTDISRPLSVRVSDWLRGDPERRQVEAVLSELAAIDSGDRRVTASGGPGDGSSTVTGSGDDDLPTVVDRLDGPGPDPALASRDDDGANSAAVDPGAASDEAGPGAVRGDDSAEAPAGDDGDPGRVDPGAVAAGTDDVDPEVSTDD